MEISPRAELMMQAPRGMHDILPGEAAQWQAIEARARTFAARFGYREIRTPLVEHTEVFERTSGETSDIVEKEMYTFADRGGRSLSLRPEGTAGVVRAYLEHGMASWPQPVRLYYIGPMFRYDRPQKGRFRLHHQFGGEILGTDAPAADVEVLSLPIRLMQSLGLTEATVRLNSVGDGACRPGYVQALREYFRPHTAELSRDSRRRLDVNPLRILDSRDPRDQELVRGAPVTRDFLCTACRAHFEQVKRLFTVIEIPYVEDPYIVRGMDYYTRTAAEIYSGRLGGAQNSMLGGGRYDGLAEALGGPHVPGVGFGQGIERLLLVLTAEGLGAATTRVISPTGIPGGEAFGSPQVFVATTGGEAEVEGFRLLDRLRTGEIAAVGEMAGRSLRAQMKSADRLGTRFTLILGDEELAAGRVTLRDMRSGEQVAVGLDEAVERLHSQLRDAG